MYTQTFLWSLKSWLSTISLLKTSNTCMKKNNNVYVKKKYFQCFTFLTHFWLVTVDDGAISMSQLYPLLVLIGDQMVWVEIATYDVRCHRKCCTKISLLCAPIIGQNKFATLHRRQWGLQMSEKFSKITLNNTLDINKQKFSNPQ
jgi:hypothetical protein